MYLKLSSPDRTIFDWEIYQIILPTEIWDVIIKPWQNPMVTALRPGIITISPKDQIDNQNFINSEIWLSISISKWMVFVNNDIVKVITTISQEIKDNDWKSLKSKKAELEKKVRKLRQSWSIEEIEEALTELEKVNADIKLKTLR